LDVFNKLLKINESEIMIIFEKSGNVWFKYRDVLKALGYFDIKHTMINMKINESNKTKYKDLEQVWSTPPP